MSSDVSLKGGEKPATDPSGPETQLVLNWTIDAVGAHHTRPGLVDCAVTGLPASPVIGLYVWGPWLVIVTENRYLWAVNEGAPTVAIPLSDATLTTQLDGGRRPTFSADGIRVVIAGGGQIQQWTGAGLSSRLGPTFPVTHLHYLANRFVGSRIDIPQTYYWSYLGDGSHQTWGPLSWATADASPDAVVGLTGTQRELWVLGESTVQVLGVGTDPYNPYEAVNTMSVGCSAPYSPVRFGNVIAWLDDRRFFVLGDGHGEPTVISHDITEVIRSFPVVSDCWGYRRDQGHDTHLIWVFPTAQRSFVFDARDQTWTEEAYLSGGQQGAMPIASYARWDALGWNVCGSSLTGAIYRYDSTAYSDLGGPLLCERITGHHDFGTDHFKRSGAVVLKLRRTVGGVSQVEVAVRDDGKPWSSWRQVAVADGTLTPTARVYIGGVFRDRQYWIRYSGTDDAALLGVKDDVSDLEAKPQKNTNG